MQSRRQFIASVGALGGCLGLGQLAPRWWQQVAAAAEGSTAGRKLVVIELQGGNDGLNTVVPYADDAYYRAAHTRHSGRRSGQTRPPSWFASGNETVAATLGGGPIGRRGKLRLSEPQSLALRIDGHLARRPARRPLTSGWLGRAADNADAGELCYVGDGAASRALSRASIRRFPRASE